MDVPRNGAWTPENLARTFPVLTNMIYANHAAMSPWPRGTQDAVAAFARDNAEFGPRDYVDWLKLETGLRQRIARMLNAPQAADIALVSNTSAGINIVANGIQWRRGDNVVTPAGEYITNQLAWDQLGARGVEVRRVDIRAADPEAALLSRMDARTRVLTVSAVQWDDGFRLDLARLGRACAGSQTVFFVDAIQQFGALPIDVQASGIDALAAGSHKWQMGPEGIGLFYCRPELRAALRLRQWGWRMLDDPYRFERPERGPSASARRFEPGSPNMMGQVALDASLAVLERFGLREVGQAVLANSMRLIEGLRAMPGVTLHSVAEPDRLSGIVSFIPAAGTARTYQALRERGVQGAVRGVAVRLSPHFYQHGDPLESLLNAVEDSIK